MYWAWWIRAYTVEKANKYKARYHPSSSHYSILMTSVTNATHLLLLELNCITPATRQKKHFNNDIIHSTRISFPFLPSKPISNKFLKRFLLQSGISSNSYQEPLKTQFFSPERVLLFVYILIFLCLRLVSTLLPLDFSQRWHNLIVFSEKAEAETKNYPSHLFKAVVAYEDRRFFQHCGVDPVGIARAVLLFPKGGGGSTITQQLVKNVFLSNDRTFLRKATEMLLALVLERKLSKSKILSSYLNKIYWGHGIYGIESASRFYFGKPPLLLSLGESAMLAGIIPAPELRSPFNEPSRGKTTQARALRRMVDVGFLDIETALSTVNQHLQLHHDWIEHPNGFPYLLKEDLSHSSKPEDLNSTVNAIWDWEKESKICEISEDMERWAMRTRNNKYYNRVYCEKILNIFFLQVIEY